MTDSLRPRGWMEPSKRQHRQMTAPPLPTSKPIRGPLDSPGPPRPGSRVMECRCAEADVFPAPTLHSAATMQVHRPEQRVEFFLHEGWGAAERHKRLKEKKPTCTVRPAVALQSGKRGREPRNAPRHSPGAGSEATRAASDLDD